MKTNKTNITILALIYKYLSTGITKLKIWDIDKFCAYLNYSLYKETGKYPIESTEETIEDVFYQDESYNYVLSEPIDLDDLCKRFIDTIPQEILLESLKQEHLDIIGAQKDKIKTNTVTDYDTRDIEVYSMSAKSACASAYKSLLFEGAKNINVRGAFYLGMKPDHLWNVTASFEKDITYIDFPGIIKYSSRKIGNQYIQYALPIPPKSDYPAPPSDVLQVEFNEENLRREDITKVTRKVRVFVYNPLTDEALIVHYAGLYMLPGGSIDKSETRIDAIKRELLEETGIEVEDQQLIPYLVINSYDKHYFDRKAGLVNRHTETVFYKIETTASIDETKKKLTESEKKKKHSVSFVPLHNMKNLVESNDTTNEKRKQFDREIIVAINELLNTLGFHEEEPKLTYSPKK